MTYVITQPCCNDAACVDVCPVDCIHPRPDEPGYATAEALHIDPTGCIDCGACVDVCPVEAIVPGDALDAAGRRSLELSIAVTREMTPAPPAPATVRPSRPARATGRAPRVAVVGTGPAGIYTVLELLERTDGHAEVTVLERLPVPGGLVRYGVAPDHARTKRFETTVTRALRRPGVRLLLDVELGRDVGTDELLDHHDAVVHAVGARQGRRLGIPGEDLPGSHSTTDVVGWYNGHPDHAGLPLDLATERAVVIGNGNVALDTARLLVSDPASLAATDMAPPALDALAASSVREVHVVGRRGPGDAAFTVPELHGLLDLPGVDTLAHRAELGTLPADGAAGRKAAAVAALADREPRPGTRRIVLRFHRRPEAILGEHAVRGVRLAGPDGDTEELACGLVLRAVGHRGVPVPGLPFDAERGTVPHDRGRVVDPTTGAARAGHYVTGWVKRGPSGVIGTNRFCAAETVESLLADHVAGRLPAPAHDAERLAVLLTERRPDHLGLDAWRAIDRHERRAGRAAGAPRRKLVTLDALREVARR
ncbi:FAD-dependent oxidoreductase [Actinomycetospora sp. TBRC 11914]|uniref:FAD-dependent oxidoreductase n=1 Tax=Actinomycetospora sp. TBRC 11914 TaxID=2729387 RepID=UPI00145E70D0|nr:FAD-dependent oxidoreductase [Actinomycetospora sp. TBRC 11914]NMO91596.1 FAD-dependent oxidoreductase [Actinomycetospora sp. TBRC 11914]